MPVRKPRLMKLTASTMASASPKDFTNSEIEASTTFGWAATCSISMP
jgi:hypothetical protein